MSETLPKGWFYTKLGNISTHPQYGWTCSANSIGKLKLLRTTDISNGKINWENVPFCEKEPDNDAKYLLKENDILVSRAGSVGISYRVAKSDLFHRTVFASYLIRFCPFVPASFVEHFFKSHLYWQYISDSQLGIAIPNVNATKLSELSIPLPPLNEQKRIAAKLDKIIPRIEAVKERLDKVPAIIKRFRQSVLTAAVTGKLTEKWRAEHPDVESAEALYKILQEKNTSKDKIYISKSLKSELFLPDIPSTWLWIKLPDSGEFGRGKSKHRPRNAKHLYGGIYPFIQTGDVAQSNGLILNHKQTYSTQGFAQSRLWPAGTICITIAANIADSAILTYPACFPDSIVGIIVNRDLYETNFIEYYIRTIKEDISLYAPATAQKNINLSILSELLVPLPPFEEQKEIVRQVDKLFAVADKLETHYKNAKAKVDKLSQSVLAKAFRGELVITEAELAEKEGRDFESAEELLNRIQKEKERLSQDTPRTRKKKREEHEKD